MTFQNFVMCSPLASSLDESKCLITNEQEHLIAASVGIGLGSNVSNFWRLGITMSRIGRIETKIILWCIYLLACLVLIMPSLNMVGD